MGRRRAAGLGAAVLLLGAVGLVVARVAQTHGGDAPSTSVPPPAASSRSACASGREDAARATRLWQRLGEAPEGARLLAALPARPRICFADVDPSVVVARTELLLDARLDRDAAAARAGHLLSHLVERDDLDPRAAQDCAAFLAAALAAETRAHRLEARLVGALGDADAAAELAATATQRAAAVVEGYRAQCERRAADGGGG